MGVVRANSRKIFEVEDKFSQNNYIFDRMQQMVPDSAVQESWTYFDPSFIIKLLSFQNKI